MLAVSSSEVPLLFIRRLVRKIRVFWRGTMFSHGLLNEMDASSPSLCSNREQSYIHPSFLLKYRIKGD